MLDLARIMSALASQRPLFHSERDFQHALAWELKAAQAVDEIRLERPLATSGQRMFVDLAAKLRDSWVGFELKFLTRALAVTIDGERYELKDQSAHDVRRYDFWRDVERLECLVAEGEIAEGWAIALTNDHLYWRPGRVGTLDEAFKAHEARVVEGSLAWSELAGPGTVKGREEPIRLRATYRVAWSGYSELGNQTGEKFRYLVLRVH